MSWIGNSPYDCPECDGDGESECSCCGVEGRCQSCRCTGWDARMVDIEAWAKAEAEFGKAEGSSWAWVDDDGNHLGYMTEGKKTLAVRDFLRKKG